MICFYLRPNITATWYHLHNKCMRFFTMTVDFIIFNPHQCHIIYNHWAGYLSLKSNSLNKESFIVDC